MDIGFGEAIPVMDIAKAMGRDLPIKEDTPGEPDSLCADTEKIRSIGWYPTYDVIEVAQEWVKRNESTELETPQQEGKEEET